MNLPNRLTILRIIFSIALIILLVFPFYSVGIEFTKYSVSGILVDFKNILAGVIFILASITDFLDGYFARKYDMVTDTGKMLDAIADKLLVNSVLIIFSSLGYLPAIVPVVIITRDTVVNAIKMEAAAKGKVVAAIQTGKIKTATLMIGIVLMFFYNLPFELMNIRVDLFFLYFATIMSLISMGEYFMMNKKVIFPPKEDE